MPATVTIVGNLGNTPERRYTPNGKEVTNFNVALYAGKDQDGEKLTTWVRITAWGKLATSAEDKLTKGQRVQVSGILNPPQVYQDKNNEYKASYEMTAFLIAIIPHDIKYSDIQDEEKEVVTP